MARLPRIVLPGIPHHVTQRGNRRQKVFFADEDYEYYLDLIATAAARAGTDILFWCLMPNHVHFLVVPHDEDGLRATFGEAHRRYTAHINARKRWTGHLWQGRFSSVAMDDAHVWAALRYVAMNPVTAGLCARAEEWRWSSAAACMGSVQGTPNTVSPGAAGTADRLSPNDGSVGDTLSSVPVASSPLPVDMAAVLERTGDFRKFLYGDSFGATGTRNTVSPTDISGGDTLLSVPVVARAEAGHFGAAGRANTLSPAAIEKALATGRPVGSAAWLKAMETRSGKVLARGKPGPKARSEGDSR